MFIELLERMRGYDKWIPVQARVASVAEVRKILGPHSREVATAAQKADFLLWMDSDGKPHCGAFIAHDTSPLSQLIGGETVSICYNPSDPDRYYSRALWVSWATHLAKALVIGMLSIGFIVWRVWMIIKHRGL